MRRTAHAAVPPTGSPHCGAPRTDVSGAVQEVAELSHGEFRLATVGPGLRVASATLDRGIVAVDLAAKRLIRIQLPPNGPIAAEARVGPGWAVTLGYGPNQRSVVRSYRVR